MKTPIYPCLWFEDQAQAAAQFYCDIFPNSKILSDNGMVVIFELNTQKYMGLNGGPMFKFNEAVSLVITCEDQAEIDFYWEKLLADGGTESQCGWLKDKFGFSWQVVPAILSELMSDPNRAQGVIAAFMKMKKFDIATLLNA